MTKNIGQIILLFAGFISINAQELKPSKFLKPNKTLHDFGIIQQANGEVSYTFVVKNFSSKSVMINNVVPECSCTEPTWTKESIALGAEGQIKVGYKADHYPGVFDKKITVYTTYDTFELKIVGKVLPKPLSNVEKEFPHSIGNLRFKDDVFAMNTIYDNSTKTKEFLVYNDSSKALKGLYFQNIPPHISIVFPEVIDSKSQAKIMVSFDPIKWNDYGHTIEYLSLVVGGVKKEMSVIGNVSPYIPNYTQAELTNAPRLKMDSLASFNFGSIQTNQVYTKRIILQNIGDSDLKILKIKPACACITIDLNEKIILKPNQTKVISLYFDTKDRSGSTKKSVYFYSNDPMDPAHVFKIIAEVK